MRTLNVMTLDGPMALNPAYVISIWQDSEGVWIQASESEPIHVTEPAYHALVANWGESLRCA